MNKRLIYSILILVCCLIKISFSQEIKETSTKGKVIKLPEPQKEIGKPLMQVLKLRKSSRSFSSKQIPVQELSNLLWAAFGINREDGKRTAPSARNWQEIDIYLTTADGAYLYNAVDNSLIQIISDDIRDKTGFFAYTKEAPLNLVFVADYSRMKNSSGSGDDNLISTSADAGFIIQNVYLYCASEGLATVVYGGVNRKALTEKLNLRNDQKIILGQSVGYHKE